MTRTVRFWLVVFLTAWLTACGIVPTRKHSRPLTHTQTEAANAVLFRAIALVGTPYRYGGNTPEGGFDCSGLVGYVFHDAAGVRLPRTSTEMSELPARKLGSNALRSGDLVFFREGWRISHVGIYVGERRFVHAPNSGGTVRLDYIDASWWREHFAYGKRVL
ncbi:MAG: C40 family peptidase [Rhodanobacter sp.]|jgi:cell wall-associated NlpC family hydrolase|nr:C40 family peptidase [Rhodanobacter sp.]